MKQLLDVSDSYAVVGLNGHAFVGQLVQGAREDDSLASTTVAAPPLCELLICPASTTEDSNNESPTVQAVAIAIVQSHVWCAVSRSDKSLCLYDVPMDMLSTKTSVSPCTVHKTPKRACSLAFAVVPGPTKKKDSPSDSCESTTVVIAGDLGGDAVAFPLVLSKVPTVSKETNDAEVGDNDNDDECNRNRRLLLGHTASMLTSVNIVDRNTEDPDDAASVSTNTLQQYILTSDRDEKIRVSAFPSTHIIHGFLLGHEAFVSSVATCRHKPYCVSLGGDDTVRLWNYSTCQQLAVASTVTTALEKTTSNTKKTEEEKPKDEGDEATSSYRPVPSKVAVTEDGDYVATICDDTVSLTLWSVRQQTNETEKEKTSLELHLCTQLACAAQPLAIFFSDKTTLLTVMKEPEHVQAFRLTKDLDGVAALTPITDDPFCKAVRQQARALSIVMPASVLERDEWGNLKMDKMNENRSGATLHPWNNIERKQVAKERGKRVRKRKLEQREIEGKNSATDKRTQEAK